MKEDAERLVEQLRVLVQPALDCAGDPALALADEKLQAVERSIRDFERLEIAVPPQLQQVRSDLAETARRRRDVMETLRYLRSSFADLQARVDRALPRPTEVAGRTKRTASRRRTALGGAGEFSHTKPRGFVLDGRHYEADTWIGLLIELAGVLAERHSDTFDRVLALRGSKHPNFSRDPADLVAPRAIGDTGFFVDAHRSASHIVRIAQALVELFGYAPNQFNIQEPTVAGG